MHGCQENMAVPGTGEENEVRKESSHSLRFFFFGVFVCCGSHGWPKGGRPNDPLYQEARDCFNGNTCEKLGDGIASVSHA